MLLLRWWHDLAYDRQGVGVPGSMLCCIACSVALQSQLVGNARSGGRFFMKFSDGDLKGGRVGGASQTLGNQLRVNR